MSFPIDLFGQSTLRALTPNFWDRVINDKALSDCTDLEKLLAGCELIAAVDQIDLLLAA